MFEQRTIVSGQPVDRPARSWAREEVVPGRLPSPRVAARPSGAPHLLWETQQRPLGV